MNFNDVRKNENKGFSLVELIVVIAIMAVMTAVLAPSLLSYVERSRAQKDDSAMGEVTNAVQLALADQQVYDEVMQHTVWGNVSFYKDSNALAANGAIITKTPTAANKVNQYYYGDEVRIKDEERFKVDGNMRGVTLTFHPEAIPGGNNTQFILSNVLVNTFVASDGTLTEDVARTEGKFDKVAYINAATSTAVEECEIGSMSGKSYLYNSIRATVGENIVLNSQTYRNSDYTVFIRMGTTGIDASSSSGIGVYGQWNGTNLDVATRDANR